METECIIVYKNGAGVIYEGQDLRQVLDKEKNLVLVYDKEKLEITLAADEIKTVLIGVFGDTGLSQRLLDEIVNGRTETAVETEESNGRYGAGAADSLRRNRGADGGVQG